jgi:hypothetical protein
VTIFVRTCVMFSCSEQDTGEILVLQAQKCEKWRPFIGRADARWGFVF